MSAFNLGAIRGLLGLDESNYVRGMLNADNANEIFGAGVVNFVNNPMLGTIRLMKGVAVGTAELLSETAKLNQEITRSAERTGFTTRTLSAMRHEFNDLGLAADAVEKALQKMNQQVALTAEGKAADPFAELGLTIKDANGNIRNSEDIYRDLTDAISKYSNEAERAALVQRFFGEEALKAMQLLGGGSGELDRVVEVFTKLGLVLRDEVSGSSVIAADAIGKLRAALEGVKYTLATEFLGGLVGESREANESIVELAGNINAKLGPAARDAGEAVRGFLKDFKDVREYPAFQGLKELWLMYRDFAQWRDLKLLPAIVDPIVEASYTEGLVGQRARESAMRDRFNARQIEIEQGHLDSNYRALIFQRESKLALLAARMAM